MRDNFPQKTKETLAKRVGYLCSNPECLALTIGPHKEVHRTVNTGVAAHITAASEGGSRYNQSLSSEQRKSITNGIWLCQKCAKLIDSDIVKYSPTRLKNWKRQAEALCKANMESNKQHLNDISKFEFDFIEPFHYTPKYHTLSNSKKSGLSITVDCYTLKETIFFNYFPPVKEWDAKKKELNSDSPYYYSIHSLKSFLEKSIKYPNTNDLLSKINKIKVIIKNNGINGLVEFLFDNENLENDVPPFRYFIKAFEQYHNLNSDQYTFQCIEHTIKFKYEEKEYIIDTYEGKSHEIRTLINKRQLEELRFFTNEEYWKAIYLDAGIDKSDFVPMLFNLLEDYWTEQFVKNVNCYTEYQKKEIKDKAWKQIQLFSDGYLDAGNVIQLAINIDEYILYPLAIIVMTRIFDEACIYSEYMEYEFWAQDVWENITVKNENVAIIRDCNDGGYEDDLFFYLVES